MMRVRWIATIPHDSAQRCEIEHDPLAGFYLYYFVNDCCEQDWHYDNIEAAKQHAFEDYGIGLASWRKLTP
jgi:hypothetical protein